jgi:DNA topoisomerase I
MKLVIIESPNKIKKLESILPPDYVVLATVGHIFDLPKKDLGVDLDTFELDLVADPNKSDILKNIKLQADSADIIYLASDMDREGEAIGFNIYASLSKKNQKKCKRLLINAITKEAVEKAIKNPAVIDTNLSDAQKGRRATDRLVGYKISPIMWSKGLKGTSAGRVQSVALKYISDLEKEIMAFKSDEYWKISLKTDEFVSELSTINGDVYSAKTKSESELIKKDIESGLATAKVTEYIKKSRTRSPEPPFITSTIQQISSTQFGWNAQKTMQVAQSLFSSGLITYLRTDSVRIEPDKINSIRDKVESGLGANYLSPSIRTYQNKDASQDAHEAIRPTYDSALGTLSSDEKKLLDLVDRRFKASQMADAIFDQASVKIEIKSKNNVYIFKLNGSVMAFDGFLKVYGDNKDDFVLPTMSKGSKIDVKSIVSSQHFTQAPGRYSDASIIKKLEKEGVGRPSTYASIIETLIKREYAKRDKKSIKATELGIMVSDLLTLTFPEIVSSEMTAKMEESLDKIAEGSSKYEDVMRDFWSILKASIDKAKKTDSKHIFQIDRDCPECKQKLVKKKGQHSIFLGCSGWPKCGFTIKIGEDGKEVQSKEESSEPCPECGGALKERKSKWGMFKGCGNYPTCSYVLKENKIKASSSTPSDLKCAECGSNMVIRKGSYGPFHACSTFPKCKYTYSEKKAKK